MEPNLRRAINWPCPSKNSILVRKSLSRPSVFALLLHTRARTNKTYSYFFDTFDDRRIFYFQVMDNIYDKVYVAIKIRIARLTMTISTHNLKCNFVENERDKKKCSHFFRSCGNNYPQNSSQKWWEILNIFTTCVSNESICCVPLGSQQRLAHM